MNNILNTTIAIRVDANNTIGIGHVMRCLAVGEQLQKQGCRIVFLCKEIPENLQGQIISRGFSLKHIPPSEGDVAPMIQYLESENAQYLVVDGYHLNDDYIHQANLMGVGTARFDDIMQDARCSADIVINASPNVDYPRYRKWAPNAKFLTGSKYFAFREEITSTYAAKTEHPHNKLNSIILNFGGSDPLDLSYEVAVALSENIPDATINVVTGAAYKEPNRLANISHGNIKHFHNINNISELMVSASLAVSAGGGTIAELELYKVPTILVITANNQNRAAHETWCQLVDNSVNKADVVDEIIQSAVKLWHSKELCNQMLDEISGELDCFGASRIAQEILNIERVVHDK